MTFSRRRLLVSLTLLAAVAPALPGQSRTITWERHAVPTTESIWSVATLDANGDGKQDLVAMGVTKVFAILQPSGAQHVLCDAHDGKMLYCVALDADQDGDLDLMVGRYLVPWIDHRQAVAAGKIGVAPKGPDFSVAWLENTGAADSPWPLHVVDRELNGIHGLCVGDVDGDGRPDVIATSISGPKFQNSLLWFRAPARGEPGFSPQVVTPGGADGRPHYLDFGDVDGDGRGDILLGDSGGGTFTWWQRATSPNAAWSKHVIARERGATNLKLVDVDGDKKPDVVASCGHGKGVLWFRGDTWDRREIDALLTTPHALAVGDFDQDGDIDVAAASYSSHIVRWYENDGRGNFVPHEIDASNQQQAYDLKAADVDGDGMLDLILAGRESRNLVWYRASR